MAIALVTARRLVGMTGERRSSGDESSRVGVEDVRRRAETILARRRGRALACCGIRAHLAALAGLLGGTTAAADGRGLGVRIHGDHLVEGLVDVLHLVRSGCVVLCTISRRVRIGR